MANNLKPITILLVEDEVAHARLIERNLRRGGMENKFIVIADGAEALDFLLRRGNYEGQARPAPLLMILDINLPGMSGFELLERIKSNPETRKVPVIMLSTTDTPEEIDRCYELGCNAYITKPLDYEAFSDTVRSLGLFVQFLAAPHV